MSESTPPLPNDGKSAPNRAAIASKGGNARASKLTKEEKTASARMAADARWSGKLPEETNDGTIDLGFTQLDCGNLDNGLRVLPTRAMSRAFNYKKTGTNITGTGAPQLPPFLATKSIIPFISDDLMVLLKSPIKYRPLQGGRTAFGYDARLLPKVCAAVVEAERAGALRDSQEHIAEFAWMLIRAFSEVGIIALVDEATGYQAERDRDELHRILHAFQLRRSATM